MNLTFIITAPHSCLVMVEEKVAGVPTRSLTGRSASEDGVEIQGEELSWSSPKSVGDVGVIGRFETTRRHFQYRRQRWGGACDLLVIYLFCCRD